MLPATVRTARAELEHLSQADTQLILEHAVARASKIDNHAVICICDREGFILALWDVGNKLPGVLPAIPATLPITFPPAFIPVFRQYGLAAGAVNRAVTAAFLSSNQNAFTSRTAGFIIEQHFPPGIKFVPPGPLLGVGFSSLFYTDVNRAKVIPKMFNGAPFQGNFPIPPGAQAANNSEGVRTPGFLFGSLDASPGGVPLYKHDTLVGGIGVTGDGSPIDFAAAAAIFFKQESKDSFAGYKTGRDTDEDVALAGQTGFRPKNSILATEATIAGIRPPYVFETTSQIGDLDENERANLGQPGAPALSGAQGHQVDIPYNDMAFFTNPQHTTLGPVIIPAGVASGFPQASPADYPHPTDTLGGVDGSVRFPFRDDPWLNDPLYTRSHIGHASRLTRNDVGTILSEAAHRCNETRAGIRLPIGTSVKTFITVVANPNMPGVPAPILGVFQVGEATVFSWDVAVQKARTALFFSQRQLAMSCTAVGFLAARYYPPGLDGRPSGPLFGFQEAVTLRRSLTGQFPGDPNLPNGITIFPGGFPLYRNGELIGAIGVSGDGVTQDDLISSSGTQEFGAPKNIRSDTFEYRGARLPYVKFPRDPAK